MPKLDDDQFNQLLEKLVGDDQLEIETAFYKGARGEDDIVEMFFRLASETFLRLEKVIHRGRLTKQEIEIAIHAFCHEVDGLAAGHYGLDR